MPCAMTAVLYTGRLWIGSNTETGAILVFDLHRLRLPTKRVAAVRNTSEPQPDAKV